MTLYTKIKVIVTVTLLMAFGFMMFRKDLYIPLCHSRRRVAVPYRIYFIWGVKHTASVDPENAHLIQEAISELTVQSPRPLSPKMRQAVVKLDKH